MKKITIIAVLICTGVFLNAQQLTSYNVEARILMTADSRSDLIQWSEKNGGFFLRDSSSFLLLKVPNKLVQNMKPVLEERSLKVLSYNMSTSSLDQEKSSVLAAIASREEILQKNLVYLDDANLEGTLALEKEISGLIQELEYYKGRLRVIDNLALFANVNIFLTAPQPTAPGSKESSFEWMKTIDFYNFVGKVFR